MAPKKPSAFAFFKEQLTPEYQKKYGVPKSKPMMMKSTLNAIMANDFKLPGVKEIFSLLRPVQGFQLPDYTKNQMYVFEEKGLAPTLNRTQPGRISKEELAKVEQPLRFNDSLWRVKSVDDDDDDDDDDEGEEAEPAAKKPKFEESSQELPEPTARTVYAIVREAYDGVDQQVFTPRFDGSATLPYTDRFLTEPLFKDWREQLCDKSIESAATSIFINNALEKPLYVDQAFTTLESAMQCLAYLHRAPGRGEQMIHRFDLESTVVDGKLYSTEFETDISGCSVGCGLWSKRATAQACLDDVVSTDCSELYESGQYSAKVIEVPLYDSFKEADKILEGSCNGKNCVWCPKVSTQKDSKAEQQTAINA